MLGTFLKRMLSNQKKVISRDFSFLDQRQQRFDYLVLLNRPIHRKLFEVLADCSKQIAVADGAANHLYQLNSKIRPAFIIGDLDSILPETRKRYQQLGVKLHHDQNQNNTDYEKTLEWIVKGSQPQLFIAVLGAFGGRIDQTLQNISSTVRLARQYPKLEMLLIDENSMMYYLRPTVLYKLRHADFQQKKGCGLISFSKATNVRSKGLRWNFDQQSGLNELQFGKLLSTSNEIVDEQVELTSDSEMFWTTTLKWHSRL